MVDPNVVDETQKKKKKKNSKASEDVQETVHVSPELVEEVVDALEQEDSDLLENILEPVHAADVADIFEQLSTPERKKLAGFISAHMDPDVLPELDDATLDDVIQEMDDQDVVEAISQLESDDAVHVLEDLEEDEQRKIIESLPVDDRLAVEEGLSFPEDSAGRLLQRNLISVPSLWTVGQVIDYIREEDGLPEDFYEIFVVDPRFHPVGTVSLSLLLRSRRHVRVEEIMDEEAHLVPADMDQEEVAYLFRQYDLTSMGVVDQDGRLLGMITFDDVVDVIDEEAEEDILRLAGVQESDISETVWEASKNRIIWLLVNLGTAILASAVIAMFDGTIEQMVALAILMPIVASMGGNAGSQTMTVAVRALATRDLTSTNALRVVSREFAISILNGLVMAVIIGVLAGIWFGDTLLGIVLAVAMVVNMIMAGLSGILVPMGLEKMNIDPALASTVFVTTITDVVGFFAFLGLAAVILL